MARVPIAEEYKTGEGGDRFPRIELTNKGEKTRFTIIEIPWREYVHFLKAPTFGEDGVAEKEERTKRSGEKYYDYKLTFVSSPICLGDEATLKESGIDPANCPACEASVKSGGDIPGPIQRFAVNVIEYVLRGNTWEVKKPFSATVKVWTFTGRIYDEIYGIQGEIGDLRKHDLTLECEDPYWKRNKLAFKMEPGYKDSPEGYIKELLTTPGNKASDEQLKDACGSTRPRSRMQDDCDFTLRQWRRLRTEGVTPDVNTGASLEGGIENLLEQESGTHAEAATAEEIAASEQSDPFAEFMPETSTAASPNGGAVASAGASAAHQPADTQPSQMAAPLSDAEQASVAVAEKAVATVAANQERVKEELAAAGDFDFDDLMKGI